MEVEKEIDGGRREGKKKKRWTTAEREKKTAAVSGEDVLCVPFRSSEG